MSKIIFCTFYRNLFAITVILFASASHLAYQNFSKEHKIESLLKTAESKGQYSGGFLVSKADKIIYKGAVGFASREWKIKNTTDTKFRINSITKQFTSLLIMQLVEDGKLRLDGKISDYLPVFPRIKGEKVSIRNLLESASGLPSLDTPFFYKGEDKRLTDSDFLIKLFLSKDLIFEPGTKFNYNNGDFIVLGAIIEKVTGKTYDEVLKEKILKPLGMKNTGLIKNGEIIGNLASGYIYSDGRYLKEPFYNIENYGSAGAMYSTLDDMLLWDKALIENKLLSKSNTEIMFKASPKLGFVALGSWVYNIKFPNGKSYKLVERQGGIGGFSSLNIISEDEKLSVIFLGNVGTQTLFRTYTKQGLSYKILETILE